LEARRLAGVKVALVALVPAQATVPATFPLGPARIKDEVTVEQTIASLKVAVST
jgi:hypothetical protein